MLSDDRRVGSFRTREEDVVTGQLPALRGDGRVQEHGHCPRGVDQGGALDFDLRVEGMRGVELVLGLLVPGLALVRVDLPELSLDGAVGVQVLGFVRLLFGTFSRSVPDGRVVFQLLVPGLRSDGFLANTVWIDIREVQSLIIVS